VSKAHQIIERLQGVRSRPDGRWMARCPAHEDRQASLGIRETSDGRVLLHCFAGCEPLDILGVIGLEMTDLFPDRLEHHMPKVGRVSLTGDALRALSHELTVIKLLADDMSRGMPSTDSCQRAKLAADRIHAAVRMCNG
jgi:hypothetical protein